MTTWRELFTKALGQHGESFGDVISASITDAEFGVDLCNGGLEGVELRMKEFAVYTSERVYYPVECMDSNALSVDSQSRNPTTLP